MHNIFAMELRRVDDYARNIVKQKVESQRPPAK